MPAPIPAVITLPGPRHINNLGKLNVIMGKNGCGKSTLLKHFDANSPAAQAKQPVRYLTPERSGTLSFDASVAQNISNLPQWSRDSRRRNQAIQFKQQTLIYYRQLEIAVLRNIEKDRSSAEDFDAMVAKINSLLDNVRLIRKESDFVVKTKDDTLELSTETISSGESELITIAIETLSFAWSCTTEIPGWLLMDEPDVHLHPDLQFRLIQFLIEIVRTGKIRVIMATHSTPILAALAEASEARVAFMKSGDADLQFRPISESLQLILPVFGAHPLSAVFTKQKLLMVEGDDDVRIWQRAVRSSNGALRLYPVAADSIDKLILLENEAASIMTTVYERPSAISLRDRDEGPEEDLGDLGPIKRFRLRCRSAENLLLADDTLSFLGSTWDGLQGKIEQWLQTHGTHPHFAEMKSFQDSGFLRKTFPLKEIRNDLLGILATNKTWEDCVGLAIVQSRLRAAGPECLRSYLGDVFCGQLSWP